jgi:hypothetical protein
LQQRHALMAAYQQILILAENCPENFGNCAALVGAEIARIEGRELDAEHLYEEAIESARINNFIQNEAVAHETAARFYGARGLQTVARAYLQNARDWESQTVGAKLFRFTRNAPPLWSVVRAS